MYELSFLIIAASVLSALMSESLSHLLIYRTDEYKKLSKQIELTVQKLEKEKESNKLKGKDNKVRKLQERKAEEDRELMMLKMKSMFAVTASMGIFLGLLYSWFDGKVVARLPFEPVSFVRGLSHRNLIGADFTECSMVFLFVLCSVGIRPTVQKLLGHKQPKGSQPSLFGPLPQQ